jgi:hypothetical protein
MGLTLRQNLIDAVPPSDLQSLQTIWRRHWRSVPKGSWRKSPQAELFGGNPVSSVAFCCRFRNASAFDSSISAKASVSVMPISFARSLARACLIAMKSFFAIASKASNSAFVPLEAAQ